VRVSTQLACWEMIRGGTTTFVDMYYFPESVARAVVVDGKLLMREGKILSADEQRVRAEADAIATRIRAAVIDREKSPSPP